MKFSIIIPAYNAENHIRKCLDSIKKQTFKDYELIVICDSCTDNTEQIAKEYGAITKKVNYHQDGQTRNAGIDMAKGDWLLFLDDDDWWLHEFVLQQLSDKIDNDPGVDLICFSFIFKGWMYATPTGNHGGHWIAVWNKCWKRKFVGDTRFTAKWSRSDVDFNTAMMYKRPVIVDWDMPMYYYNYMRTGSISYQDRKGVVK